MKVCEKCQQECDVVEIDEGGWEEIWGAKIWHHQRVDASSCCHEPIEEMEVEDDI